MVNGKTTRLMLEEVQKIRAVRNIPCERLLLGDIVYLTYNSNAIEMNPLSENDVHDILSTGRVPEGKRMQHVLEVEGLSRAAWEAGLAISRSKGRFIEDDIKEIHRCFMRRVSPKNAGRYRSAEVFTRLRNGSTHEFPAFSHVPSLMRSLFRDFGTCPESEDMSVVYGWFGSFHYKLASIHPFIDGNGRAARLFSSFSMMRYGFPPLTVPFEERNAYLNALANGEKEFKEFFGCVIQAELSKYVDRLSLMSIDDTREFAPYDFAAVRSAKTSGNDALEYALCS